MSKEEGDKLLNEYKKFQKKKADLSKISLNNYLNTAAICYQTAFVNEIPKMLQRAKIKEATPEFLH